jgi:lipopolysaccharide transport system ATP-binding protein
MDAILRLCTNCIFLKNGSLIEKGDADKVISSYLSAEANLSSFIKYPENDSAPGDEHVRLISSEVINDKLESKTNFSITDKVGIRITFKVLIKTKDLVAGFNLYNRLDVHILSSHDLTNKPKTYEPGVYETVVWLPAGFLAEGMHYCGIAAMSANPFTIHFHDINKFAFNVIDNQLENIREYFSGDIPGVVRPTLEWDIMKRLN